MQSLMIDPRTLQPNPWNTNHVSPENEAKIEESIKRFGMFRHVVCRELSNGTLQILGGEHRTKVAIQMGIAEIPVVNLGPVEDKKAQEIGLVDNGRYGDDDALELADLLQGLGNPDEISRYLPYDEHDLSAIFSSMSIDLDGLDLPDDAGSPAPLPEKLAQTHQIMRFKVPVEDAQKVSDLIEFIMKQQGFTQEDSLSNAGNALVHLCNIGVKNEQSI